MPRAVIDDSQCANPLLVQFVKEWLDQARDRNSKGVSAYKKAYGSLRVCPLIFQHPSEASTLNGIGDKLCARLTAKLEEYCEENGLPKPVRPKKGKKRPLVIGEDGEEASASPSPRKKVKKAQKAYVPKYGTGPYAILIALATLENDDRGINKEEVIRLAQPHTDVSFTVPQDRGKLYTAWSSMKTLVGDKHLVTERKGMGGLKLYALSDDGWLMIEALKKADEGRDGGTAAFRIAEPAGDDDFPDLGGTSDLTLAVAREVETSTEAIDSGLISQGRFVASSSDLPQCTPIVLEPGSFSVELVLDRREVFGRHDRDYMEKNLTNKGVTPIMRELKLGDMLWVAKMHDPGLLSRRGLEGDEIMLDYIVERKRLDDFVSSIKDGRFHDQKFRMRKTCMKNAIYVIEDITQQSESIKSMQEAMDSALAATQVIDGYFVKKTLRPDDTIDYLVRMTKMLKKVYHNKPLHIIPTNIITVNNYAPLQKSLRESQPGTAHYITYDVFAYLGSKSENLNQRDIFLKMLMCIKGLTGEKAIGLQRKWKTPKEFIEAYRKIEEVHGNDELGRRRKGDMVALAMDNPVPRKKIMKALSAKIAEVWGDAGGAVD